jgi:hypothetical protein
MSDDETKPPRYVSVIQIYGYDEDDAMCNYVDLNLLSEEDQTIYLNELQKDFKSCMKETITNIPLRTQITEDYGVEPEMNATVVNTFIIWEDHVLEKKPLRFDQIVNVEALDKFITDK